MATGSRAVGVVDGPVSTSTGRAPVLAWPVALQQEDS